MNQTNPMQASASSSKFAISLPVVATVLAIIAFLASGFAIFLVLRPMQAIQNVPLPPSPDANDLLVQAQSTVNMAFEQVNQYLALLQTMTAILGIAGIVITVFGVLNLSRVGELRGEMETQSRATAEAQKHLETIQTQVGDEFTRLHKFETELDAKIDENRRIIQSVTQIQYAVTQADLGNFSTAQTILEDVSTNLPDNPVVNYYLGDFLARQGDIDKGADYLEKAQQAKYFWAAKASYAYVLRLKADRLTVETAQQAQYATVDEIFRTVYIEAPLLLDVQGESAFGAWAGLHKRQGNIKEAIEIYEHCAKVTPPSSYPLINLGTLHLENDGKQFEKLLCSYDKGINYFQQALAKSQIRMQLNPTDHWPILDAILSRAVISDSVSNTDAIQQLWQRIVDLNVIGVDRDKLKDSLRGLLKISKIKDRVQTVLNLIDPQNKLPTNT